MSVRQYIGARYVTKVYENSLDPSSAEWEGSRAYEPLTLVTYLNSSYLSKKEVPANIGDPASNPAYWVITGAYNGQITTLQNQISNIMQLISTDTIIMSDSYGERVNNDGKTFAELIADNLMIDTYYHFQKNGIGFTNAGGNGTFEQHLSDNISNVSNPDNITNIIVLGGANDNGNNQSAIETAIKSFITYAKTVCPNAHIYIGHIGTKRTDYSSIYPYANASIPAYQNSGVYGGIYLTGSEILLHSNTYLEADLIHPNAAGVDAIASGITMALKGGRGHIKTENAAVLSADGTVISNINFSDYITEKIIDDNVYFECQTDRHVMNLDLVNGLTTIRTFVQIGTFSDPLILDSRSQILIPVNVEIFNGSTFVDDEPGYFTLDNSGNLCLAIVLTKNTYATATQLRILPNACSSIASYEC